MENIKLEIEKLKLVDNMTSQEVDHELDELSRTFTPDHSTVTINPKGDGDEDELKKTFLKELLKFRILVECDFDEEVCNELGFKDVNL